MTVAFPASSPARTTCYRLWGVWGVSSVPGEHLLEYFEHVDNGEVLDPGVAAEKPLAHARRFLAEVLGLAPVSWLGEPALAQARRNPKFPRGEFVKVRFELDRTPTPCIVVSDDSLNGHAPNSLIVLQTIPYLEAHEDYVTVLPVAEKPLGKQPLSVVYTLLRGIERRATRLVKRYSPPIRLDNDVMNSEVLPALEALYGSP